VSEFAYFSRGGYSGGCALEGGRGVNSDSRPTGKRVLAPRSWMGVFVDSNAWQVRADHDNLYVFWRGLSWLGYGC